MEENMLSQMVDNNKYIIMIVDFCPGVKKQGIKHQSKAVYYKPIQLV